MIGSSESLGRLENVCSCARVPASLGSDAFRPTGCNVISNDLESSGNLASKGTYIYQYGKSITYNASKGKISRPEYGELPVGSYFRHRSDILSLGCFI